MLRKSQNYVKVIYNKVRMLYNNKVNFVYRTEEICLDLILIKEHYI